MACFDPSPPTAACGTCCQRLNCVGFLNVHIMLLLKHGDFCLAFVWLFSNPLFLCTWLTWAPQCLAWLVLAAMKLWYRWSALPSTLCHCTYYWCRCVLWGEWNASSEYLIVHLKQKAICKRCMIRSYTNPKQGMFCSRKACQMNLEISQANIENTKEQSVFRESFTKSGHDVIFSKAQAWLVAL